jgi:hypothetical protein
MLRITRSFFSNASGNTAHPALNLSPIKKPGSGTDYQAKAPHLKLISG